jgi:NAD/NADP transhydrogenase beta subunit
MLSDLLMIVTILLGVGTLLSFLRQGLKRQTSILQMSFLVCCLLYALPYFGPSTVLLLCVSLIGAMTIVFWFVNNLEGTKPIDLLPLVPCLLGLGTTVAIANTLIKFGGTQLPLEHLALLLALALGMNITAAGLVAFLRRVKLEWNPIPYEFRFIQHYLVFAGIILTLTAAGAGFYFGTDYLILYALIPGMMFLGWITGLLQYAPYQRTDQRYLMPWAMSLFGLLLALTAGVYFDVAVLICGSLIAGCYFEIWLKECRATHLKPWKVVSGRFRTEIPMSKAGVIDPAVIPPLMNLPTNIQVTTAQTTMTWLKSSKNVVLIPGTGAIQSQAISALFELYSMLLHFPGMNVSVCVHPEAGHVDGELLQQLFQFKFDSAHVVSDLVAAQALINQADCIIGIGANDVLNPKLQLGKKELSSFQITNEAKVILIKRTLAAGKRRTKNALFTREQTTLLFDEAAIALQKMVKGISEDVTEERPFSNAIPEPVIAPMDVSATSIVDGDSFVDDVRLADEPLEDEPLEELPDLSSFDAETDIDADTDSDEIPPLSSETQG